MFNLFRSQGKAAKYLLSGLFFLLALSMLMYLVPNYGGSTDQTGTNAVLLQVGEQKLTSAEAQAEFSRAYQGQVPAEMIATFFPQWLDQTKQRFAVLEEARRLGIVTSNDEIAEALAKAPGFAPFFENGKLINREGFAAAIAQLPGYTVDRVFKEMRDTLNSGKLADAVSETSVVTPKEIEEAYKRKHELASIDYVSFLESDWLPKVKISDAELQAQYDRSKDSYPQPEKFAFRVAVLSQTTVESKITVTDADVRAAYTANLDNFRTPESMHARHILKMTEGKSADEKAQLRKQAEEILKQVKGGADFGEVAKKNSDDAASTGGDLGTFGRGKMVKPFEDAAFALKPNEISGIVESEFGYHIIQVLEKTPSIIRPLETVRADIETELRKQKLATAMETASTALHAEIKKSPAQISAAAEKAGAQVIAISEAPAGTAIPTLGVTPEIDKVLPVLQPGSVSDILALPGDRVAVVILDKKIPSRPSTFEEARDSILNLMRNNAARKLVEDRSQEAAKRLRAGEDIQAVAKALETTVHAASSFNLTDSLPDIGPAAPLEDAFRKGPGTVIGPVLMQSRQVVAKVVSKTEADPAGFESEKKTLLTTLRQERARQNNTLWQDSIVQKLTNDGSIIVNAAELQRVISQMR
jgi:peptidyl-prolyl cis-trans isomerase D